MARKKPTPAAGCPEWMLTYGDMMGLLMCFFVILFSMSEIKETDKYDEMAESMRAAFGNKSGISKFFGMNSPNKQLIDIIIEKFQLKKGKSAEEGIEGENPSVTTVREGLEFTLGGRVHFEPGKATLPEGDVKQITDFAGTIKGLNTKVRVKGHAATAPGELVAPFTSLDELSYARALEVKKLLMECGIREERITAEACGDNEPLETRAYDEASQALNRRVSIIVTENLVKDYEGEGVKKEDTIF